MLMPRMAERLWNSERIASCNGVRGGRLMICNSTGCVISAVVDIILKT